MLSFNNNKECGNLIGRQSLKRKEPPPNNPWLYLSQQKNVVGAQSSVPGRLGSWHSDPQRCGKAASEKECHKQEGEEEEGLSVCLLNEAKNGKRVWCRSGTQPAFSKWGRLNFPTSSPTQNNFQNSLPPPTPPLQLNLFHPLMEGWKDCILPASLSCSTRNHLDHRKRGGKMGVGDREQTPPQFLLTVGISTSQIEKAKTKHKTVQ